MGLLDKIEKLQKKPEPYRRKVLFASVFAIMSVIILIRFVSWEFFEENKKETSKSIYEPIDIISKDIKSAKDGIVDSFDRAKNLFLKLKNYEGQK